MDHTPIAASIKGTRLLRMKDLTERIGVVPSTIYRWIDAGLFPKSLPLGPRAVRWREADVEAFIASRGEDTPCG